MGKALVFEAPREGYGIDQVERPMTVGELREFLEDFDDDTLFILSHDMRYTYGSIRREGALTYEEDADGSWEATDW